MSLQQTLCSITVLLTLLAVNADLDARTMKVDTSREKVILGLGGGYAPVLDTFSSFIPHGGSAYLNASFSLAPLTGNRWSPVVEVFIDFVDIKNKITSSKYKIFIAKRLNSQIKINESRDSYL